MIQRIRRFFKRLRERATQTTVPLAPPKPIDYAVKPYPIRFALDDFGCHYPEGTPTGTIANWLYDAGRKEEAILLLEGVAVRGYFILGLWKPQTNQVITFKTTDAKLAQEWNETEFLVIHQSAYALFGFVAYLEAGEVMLRGTPPKAVHDLLKDWKEPTPEELQKDRAYIKDYLTYKVSELDRHRLRNWQPDRFLKIYTPETPPQE